MADLLALLWWVRLSGGGGPQSAVVGVKKESRADGILGNSEGESGWFGEILASTVCEIVKVMMLVVDRGVRQQQVYDTLGRKGLCSQRVKKNVVTTYLVVGKGKTEILAKWFVEELSDRRDLRLALGQKMSCDNSPTEEIQDQMSDGRQSMVCEVVVEDSFCIA